MLSLYCVYFQDYLLLCNLLVSSSSEKTISLTFCTSWVPIVLHVAWVPPPIHFGITNFLILVNFVFIQSY